MSAVERSTFVVSVSFFDEQGMPVVPDSCVWTLIDERGRVVNDREQVPILSLSADVDILLRGDDLVVINQRRSEESRRIVVEATYTSALGSGLPNNQEYLFTVKNLAYIE